MSTPFTPSRDDGRSDRQVIYDLVHNNVADFAGPIWTYNELRDALQDGVEKPIDRPRIYAAVRQANSTLLREHSRYLGVVENVGYRMLRADEHLPVSLQKKDRAQTHLRRGIELLKHARLDELTEAQRTLHEGQLMILSGIYHAVEDSHKRHDRTESLIEDLLKQQQETEARLQRLENED